jgi:hypothetical protein
MIKFQRAEKLHGITSVVFMRFLYTIWCEYAYMHCPWESRILADFVNHEVKLHDKIH